MTKEKKIVQLECRHCGKIVRPKKITLKIPRRLRKFTPKSIAAKAER